MKTTLKQGMLDLANCFLGRINCSDKKLWKQEEIVSEFYSAMFELTLLYLDDLEKGGERQGGGIDV